jgi:hypothetical protein
MSKILPIPEGWEIDDRMSSIIIRYKWSKKIALVLLIFSVFWNGFLVFWFLLPTPIFFKLFAIIHAGVGVGLVWYSLCSFLNETKISISRYELAITHSPIPFPTYKNMILEKFDIQQIYITQKTNDKKGNTTYSYVLNVLSPKNNVRKLSLSYDNYEQAIFVKRKVEECMSIEPQEIEGEYLEN